MATTASCFAQVLSLVDRNDFARAVRRHDAERGSKGFSCWEQFVSMLFCQVGAANSLREICGGLATAMGKLVHLGMDKAPRRSTLAYDDYRLFAAWTEAEVFFVTRAKHNMVYEVLEEREVCSCWE